MTNSNFFGPRSGDLSAKFSAFSAPSRKDPAQTRILQFRAAAAMPANQFMARTLVPLGYGNSQ